MGCVNSCLTLSNVSYKEKLIRKSCSYSDDTSGVSLPNFNAGLSSTIHYRNRNSTLEKFKTIDLVLEDTEPNTSNNSVELFEEELSSESSDTSMDSSILNWSLSMDKSNESSSSWVTTASESSMSFTSDLQSLFDEMRELKNSIGSFLVDEGDLGNIISVSESDEESSEEPDAVHEIFENSSHFNNERNALEERLTIEENLAIQSEFHFAKRKIDIEKKTNTFNYKSKGVEELESSYDKKLPTCIICLSAFEDKQTIRILPCMHMGHRSCIDKWFTKKSNCSICRRDIMCGFEQQLVNRTKSTH